MKNTYIIGTKNIFKSFKKYKQSIQNNLNLTFGTKWIKSNWYHSIKKENKINYTLIW